jgi:hypothetical protein
VVATLAVLITAYVASATLGCGGNRTTERAADAGGAVVTLDARYEPLVSRFNADSTKVRVVLLVAPS